MSSRRPEARARGATFFSPCVYIPLSFSLSPSRSFAPSVLVASTHREACVPTHTRTSRAAHTALSETSPFFRRPSRSLLLEARDAERLARHTRSLGDEPRAGGGRGPAGSRGFDQGPSGLFAGTERRWLRAASSARGARKRARRRKRGRTRHGRGERSGRARARETARLWPHASPLSVGARWAASSSGGGGRWSRDVDVRRRRLTWALGLATLAGLLVDGLGAPAAASSPRWEPPLPGGASPGRAGYPASAAGRGSLLRWTGWSRRCAPLPRALLALLLPLLAEPPPRRLELAGPGLGAGLLRVCGLLFLQLTTRTRRR